jgi:hypothetical protein
MLFSLRARPWGADSAIGVNHGPSSNLSCDLGESLRGWGGDAERELEDRGETLGGRHSGERESGYQGGAEDCREHAETEIEARVPALVFVAIEEAEADGEDQHGQDES